MALDVGLRRIGVAVTDPLGILARPLLAVDRTSPAADAAAIAALAVEWEAVRLVVGLPLLPSGDRGEQARNVEELVEVLRAATDVPIEMWDESGTTVTATERLDMRGRLRDEEKARLDAAAAAVILEEWLEARRCERRGDKEVRC